MAALAEVGRAICAVLFLLCVVPGGTAAGTVIESVPDQALFSFEYRGATDFSALTWAGGRDYFTVSDKVKAIFPMSIEMDQATGRILSTTIGDAISVPTKRSDFEGVAILRNRRRIFISTESECGIFGFDLQKRTMISVGIPPVFANARANKGLESLAYDATVGNFWTANEEALKCDGPVSDREHGTVVRLQRFDGRFRPAGQFAYVTETSAFRVAGAGSGVSDLALLPNGELLVLERIVGKVGLSVEIFRAELRGATDVSRIPALEGAAYTSTGKTRIFSRATLTNNFEGIALGPALEGGWRSLILIADSGGGTTHYLMPLRIRWSGE